MTELKMVDGHPQMPASVPPRSVRISLSPKIPLTPERAEEIAQAAYNWCYTRRFYYVGKTSRTVYCKYEEALLALLECDGVET
jgi:hypothetical protein